jgi:FkbM family methyltransferase
MDVSDAKKIIELQQAGARNWYLHLFEEIIAGFYTSILSEGDFVIDGGAHAGLHTIPLADAVGENGKVLAFEPIPHFTQVLQSLLDQRNIKHVEIRRAALSRRKGRAVFHWIKNRQAESSLSSIDINHLVDEIESFEVDTLCLDDIIPSLGSDYGPLRFLKMDLEGAEFDALRGSKSILKQFHPSIVLEFGYHKTAETWGYNQAVWDAFFEEIGYNLYDLAGRSILSLPWGHIDNPIWYLIAVPKDSEDDVFVKNNLPDLIDASARKWSDALASGRPPATLCWHDHV